MARRQRDDRARVTVVEQLSQRIQGGINRGRVVVHLPVVDVVADDERLIDGVPDTAVGGGPAVTRAADIRNLASRTSSSAARSMSPAMSMGPLSAVFCQLYGTTWIASRGTTRRALSLVPSSVR